MKKLFGGINLTWPKIIVGAILTGIYVAIVCLIPQLLHTSFHDIAVTLEVWVLIGIFIIMNSKSNVDSALKCFVFFLISQPLVYLIQVPFNELGWQLFNFYPFWFGMTVLCLPMGFIGYYLKMDKWWGLFILCPMLLVVCLSYHQYLNQMMFSFPEHLITVIFCVITMIGYPIIIFSEKKVKVAGVIFSILAISLSSIINLQKPGVYDAHLFSSGGSQKIVFTDKDKVSLADESFGTITIEYDKNMDSYEIVGHFVKSGETKIFIETKDGDFVYDISIRQNTYELTRVKADVPIDNMKGIEELISYKVLKNYKKVDEQKLDKNDLVYEINYEDSKNEGYFTVGIFSYKGIDFLNDEREVLDENEFIYSLTKSSTLEVDGYTFDVGYSGQDDHENVIARAYVKYGDYVIELSMRKSDDFITDKQYEEFIEMVKSVKFIK